MVERRLCIPEASGSRPLSSTSRGQRAHATSDPGPSCGRGNAVRLHPPATHGPRARGARNALSARSEEAPRCRAGAYTRSCSSAAERLHDSQEAGGSAPPGTTRGGQLAGRRRLPARGGPPRTDSSAGRAPRLHRGCLRFDPGLVHIVPRPTPRVTEVAAASRATASPTGSPPPQGYGE